MADADWVDPDEAREVVAAAAGLPEPRPITHIAATEVRVTNDRGPCLRQRCAWCGAVLVDYQLERVAIAVDPHEESRSREPATWPVGSLVKVHGNMTAAVPSEDGVLPEDACALLFPDEVTR